MHLVIILSLGGIASVGVGLVLLLKKGFVEKLRRGIWRDESGLVPDKAGYAYDKYVRGFELVFLGIVLLIVAGIIFLSPAK